jgi:hypothetical protein
MFNDTAFKWTECTMQHKDGSFSQWRMSLISELDSLRNRAEYPLRSVWIYDSPKTEAYTNSNGKTVYRPIGRKIGDMHFDFDCGNNPTKARNDALFILDKLNRDYGLNLESVRIIFSGSKGFGVIVPYQCFLLEPIDNIEMVYRYFCEMLHRNAPTLDMGIYIKRRMWKLEGTPHPKTGLFRIDLSLNELQTLTIDEIRSLSEKGPRFLKYISPVFTPALSFFIRREYTQKKTILMRRKSRKRREFLTLPPEERIPKKYRQIVREGNRNPTICRLCGTLKRAGVCSSEIEEIVLAFNRLYCSPPKSDDEALIPIKHYL